MKTGDLHWLAGLLEGEGSFSCAQRPGKGRIARILVDPCVRLSMTDRDVVQRATTLLKGRMYVSKRKTLGGKTVYHAVSTGNRAMGWMMTLLSLMGDRRRARIEQCLSTWKAAEGNGRKGWSNGPLSQETKAKISLARRLHHARATTDMAALCAVRTPGFAPREASRSTRESRLRG